jgi:hypothetical protein
MFRQCQLAQFNLPGINQSARSPTSLCTFNHVNAARRLANTPPPDDAASVVRATVFSATAMNDVVVRPRRNVGMSAVVEVDGRLWPTSGDGSIIASPRAPPPPCAVGGRPLLHPSINGYDRADRATRRTGRSCWLMRWRNHRR